MRLMVMTVVLPLLGGAEQNLPLALAMAVGKAALFIGITLVSGLWLLPWLMGRVGGVRSRELFLLTVLVLCLGAALGTQIFGLSMVFGAFLIGLVLRESRFAHQALAEVTPLRDIFATLFFVSLGMLLDPRFIIEHWPSVLMVVIIILAVKSAIIFGIVRFFGYSGRIGVLTAVGLFQIGEFGFILAQGGLDIGIISDQMHSLLLASATITMLLSPLALALASRLYLKIGSVIVFGRPPAEKVSLASTPVSSEEPTRVVVAGYGRIGQNIARRLQDASIPYTIIDIDPERISDARSVGRPRIYGDASNPHVLANAGLDKARTLVVTFPDPLAVVATVKTALEINPKLKIIARVHRMREAEQLKNMGVEDLVSPEYQASLEFMNRILAASK